MTAKRWLGTIAWMSDGSPVPASPEQFDQMREMVKLIQERDEWKAKAEETLFLLRKVNDQSEALQAEVERMKPVVDAAVALVAGRHVMRDPWEAGVFEAVRAYQNAQPATVGDVLDGIRENYEAALSETVKNCTTCRFSCNVAIEICTKHAPAIAAARAEGGE